MRTDRRLQGAGLDFGVVQQGCSCLLFELQYLVEVLLQTEGTWRRGFWLEGKTMATPRVSLQQA